MQIVMLWRWNLPNPVRWMSRMFRSLKILCLHLMFRCPGWRFIRLALGTLWRRLSIRLLILWLPIPSSWSLRLSSAQPPLVVLLRFSRLRLGAASQRRISLVLSMSPDVRRPPGTSRSQRGKTSGYIVLLGHQFVGFIIIIFRVFEVDDNFFNRLMYMYYL
jgi:hypothetical protein